MIVDSRFQAVRNTLGNSKKDARQKSAIVFYVTKVGATSLERFNSLRRFRFTRCCLAMIIRKNITPLALSNQAALTYSLFVFFS